MGGQWPVQKVGEETQRKTWGSSGCCAARCLELRWARPGGSAWHPVTASPINPELNAYLLIRIVNNTCQSLPPLSLLGIKLPPCQSRIWFNVPDATIVLPPRLAGSGRFPCCFWNHQGFPMAITTDIIVSGLSSFQWCNHALYSCSYDN